MRIVYVVFYFFFIFGHYSQATFRVYYYIIKNMFIIIPKWQQCVQNFMYAAE